VTERLLDPWHCTLDDFASADAPMRRCLGLARAAAQTELPVLILGESGTGKTLLARAIHNSSKRSSAAFVSFNAAALSDTLLDRLRAAAGGRRPPRLGHAPAAGRVHGNRPLPEGSVRLAICNVVAEF